MSETTQTEQKPRTASERLDNLEQGYVGLYQTVNGMARDILVLKEAVKLLGNKLDSIVKVTTRGESLTDENISKVMIENNTEELKSRVETLKFQGILLDSEIIDRESFVVGEELDETGVIVNPRLQFSVQSFNEDLASKLVGGKKGDVLNIEEGKFTFKVTEIYSVNTPKTEAQAQA